MKRLSSLALLVLMTATLAAVPAEARKGPSLRYAHGTRAPRFVDQLSVAPRRAEPSAIALRYLAANEDRFRIADPAESLVLLDVAKDSRTTTVRFGQLEAGIPVWGAQYLVHLARSEEGLAPEVINGHYFTDLDVPTSPTFGPDVAIRLATSRARLISPEKVYRHGLTVLPIGSGVLAYHFTMRGEFLDRELLQEVFINAVTGAVAMSFNNLQSDGPATAPGLTSPGEQVTLDVFNRGSIYELRDQSKPMFAAHGGEIRTHDVQGRPKYLATEDNLVISGDQLFDGSETSSGAVDAHINASMVYDFYYSLGRDSIDGQGGSIVSSVNATENGKPMFNAFWDGINKQMVYGNPNPSQYHPFSASLDVVGHELTHGVTQHTANLAYVNQSGAMNEAYSDYFGNAIDVNHTGISMQDPKAGYLGEALCKTSRPSNFSCPLRDLNDGSTTTDYVYFLADLDNGGVHLNSTIYGGTLWDIREDLGANADRYIYRALEAYETPLDDFVDGRNAIVAAARELGATDIEIQAIEDDFTAHGITDGWDVAPSTDATVLMQNVAPITDIGFSEPQLSGTLFAIGDYADKSQICCTGLQIFAGRTDGSEEVTQVSQGAGSSVLSDESPDVDGANIIWSRIHLENAQPVSADIVGRFRGGLQKKIASTGGMLMNPSIDGRLVAWERLGRNSDIQARYLGRPIATVRDGRGNQLMPQVGGDWIAWWNTRGQPRIEALNARTGAQRVIKAPDGTLVGPPSIQGRYLLWYQDNDFDAIGSIRRMDLVTGAKKVLVPESSDAAPIWALSLTTPPVPSANSGSVVYSSELAYALEFGGAPDLIENDEVGRDIFIVPLNGGQPQPVTSNRADQAFPLMGSGRRVIWLDSSEARTDLVTREVP